MAHMRKSEDYPNILKMTYAEALVHIWDFTLVKAGTEAQAVLDAHKGRSIPKSLLEKTAQGYCAWCNRGQIPSGRRKYCSENCTESAFFVMYPQSPSSKMYRFIKLQDCVCQYCGQDFKDQVAEIVRQRVNRNMKGERVRYFSIGFNTGEDWHTDHKEPIHKGGSAIDLNNLWVICKRCHIHKTAEERRK